MSTKIIQATIARKLYFYIKIHINSYFRTEELNRGMSSGIITRSKAAQLNRFVFIIWLPNGAFRWIFFKRRTVLYFFRKTGKRYRRNSFAS